MTLKPMPWLLTNHYLVIAMRDVRYPISKAELIEQIGQVEIPTGYDQVSTIESIIARLPLDYYRNAAEFFCNISAS